jgi:phosphate uptake regulator
MKRKVIQIGESTQLVSIPREWSLAHNVKKGDELEVIGDANKLTITAGEKNVVKATTLDLASMRTLKRRSICAAYLRGFNEVEVHYTSPEYIQVIQQVLTEFPGYEIVRQGKTSCFIKQISVPRPGEFESVFNRLFLLMHDTSLYIAEALQKKDTEMLKSIPYREVNINKFANFCRRLINNGAMPAVEDATVNYFILSKLEQLGDDYKALASYLVENVDVPKEVNEILKDAAAFLERIYRLHTKPKTDLAIENSLCYNALQEKIHKIAGKADPYLFHHLANVVNTMILIQEPMLQLVVGATSRQESA